MYLRLDKILIILSLCSYFYEPTKGTIKVIYYEIIKIIKNNYIFIFLYCSIIFSSLVFLLVRNYILVNELVLINRQSFEITLQTKTY